MAKGKSYKSMVLDKHDKAKCMREGAMEYFCVRLKGWSDIPSNPIVGYGTSSTEAWEKTAIGLGLVKENVSA